MAVSDKKPGPKTGASAEEAPYPSEGYAWYVVLILMIVYIFSFIDRQIFGLLVGPIKQDLHISDTAIGFLGGTTFAIFYTLFGIPLGRLADSRSRRGLIAIGLFLWSLMTAACGIAKSYWHLLIFRVGVGVGEATLSPCAYSMIADYFRPSRLALAISVYGAGIYIGSGMAQLLGGMVVGWATQQEAYEFALIGTVRPWQMVFFVIGLPGMLFTIALYTVREPLRRGVLKANAHTAAKQIPMREVFTYIKANWGTFVCHTFGFACMSFIGYATIFWIPTMFDRIHGWALKDFAFRYGIAIMIFGTAGIIFGGLLADMLAARGSKDAKMRTGMYGALVHLPFALLFPLVKDPWLAFALLCPATFAAAMPFGVAPAAIQEMMPNQMRGQAAAVYLFVVNLIGIGLGPLAVGFLTDYVFTEQTVHYSLLTANGTANILAVLLLFLGMAKFRTSIVYRDKYLSTH